MTEIVVTVQEAYDHEYQIKTHKQCTRCERVLPVTEFGWTRRDGFRSHCKECRRKDSKEYHAKNKELIKMKSKVWRDKNKEYMKDYRKKNFEKQSKYHKQYRIENKDRLRIQAKLYREKNWEKLLEARKAFGKTAKAIHWRLKASAIKRGMSFQIPFKDFRNWYDKQQKVCVYCGIDEESLKTLGTFWTGKNKYHRMSIDRMDNEFHYELSNIVLACFSCNQIKGRHLSFEQMKFIGANFLKLKWQNLLKSLEKAAPNVNLIA